MTSKLHAILPGLLIAFVLGACIQDPTGFSYEPVEQDGQDRIDVGDVAVVEDADANMDADVRQTIDIVEVEDTRDVSQADVADVSDVPSGIDVEADVSIDAETDADVDTGPPPPQRVTEGLLLYYPFLEGAGQSTADQSALAPSLDLTITGHHAWLAQGGIQFLPAGNDQPVGRAYSANAVAKIQDHMVQGNPFSVELWVTVPAMVGGIDYGPGRIFALAPDGNPWAQDYFVVGTYSAGGSDVLGAPYLTFRFHNSTFNEVEIVVEPPTEAAVHYVLTYDGTVFRLYQDGMEIAQRSMAVNFANWAYEHRVRVGNSAVENRQFAGGIHLIAMYERALSEEEIGENYTSR